MQDGKKLSLEQIQTFLEASEEVRFQAQDRGELYGWVNQILRQQDYGRLPRRGKGLVRQYLAKMTGLSRAQVARLIRSYQQGNEVKPRAYDDIVSRRAIPAPISNCWRWWTRRTKPSVVLRLKRFW